MKLTINDQTYCVDFTHLPEQTTPYGIGETRCYLLDMPGPSARLLASGSAYCGKSDRYNKRKGRKISFSYMLEEFNVSREWRGAWWDAYFAAQPQDRVN